MFYDECSGSSVILEDYATGLGAVIIKTLNQNKVLSGKV